MFIFILIYLISFGPNSSSFAQQPDVNEPEDLFDMSIEELLKVEVSVASKKPEPPIDAPGVVVVVPQNEIDLYGDRNLHQLLQRQPSIYTRGSYLYPHNLTSCRGDMPTHLDLHTLLLINGRPIRDSSHGGINFPVYMTYPLHSLSSVEIIRGPGSVLYGTNAFTGVVDLKSRAIPEQTKFSLFGMGGSEGYWTTALSGGGRFGKLGFVTDLQTTGQQGYKYALVDGTGTYGSDYDTNRSISTMNHFELGRLTLDVFYSNLETFYMGVVPFWNFSDNIYRSNKLFSNLGYKLPLDERLRLEFNLTYNLSKYNFDRPVKYETDLDSEDWLGEVTLFANPNDNLNILFGCLQENQRKIPNNDSDTTIDPPYNVEPRSTYAQADYRVNETVRLIGGTQWNKAAYGSTDLLSRVGVIITPFKKWGVKLLRGEAFRAPFALETNLYDIVVLIGNKDLEPEKIVTYDTQLFYHDEKTFAALTYFKSKINNLIIRGTNPAPPPPRMFTNGGEQQFDGIELEAKRFLTSRWHVLGSFMHQENEQSSDIDHSVVPDDMFKFGTAYTWDWGSAAMFYSFFGKPPRLYTEVVVNPEPDALSLLSLNVQIDPSRWLDVPKGRSILTFKVENLFDEDIYVPEFQRGGNPNSLSDGPGRTFYAGLRMHF